MVPLRTRDLSDRETRSVSSCNNAPAVTAKARYSLHFSSRGNRPVFALILVRVGAAGLDGDTPPSRSPNIAYRLAFLRHRHRSGSLASVPTHGGGDLARSSRGHRTGTWTVSSACSRRGCVSRRSRVACRWRCCCCMRGNTVRISASVSPQDYDWPVVTGNRRQNARSERNRVAHGQPARRNIVGWPRIHTGKNDAWEVHHAF
jgi:hypothetical protein